MVGLGIRFRRDLPFAVAVQTLAFVALNRVVTAQYFFWAIAVLPLALHQARVPWYLFLLWLGAEVRVASPASWAL